MFMAAGLIYDARARSDQGCGHRTGAADRSWPLHWAVCR
jgi:hypothetical protein